MNTRTITLQRPTVVPWRYWATVLTSRTFAYFLSAADAVISYQGFRKLQMDHFPAATLSGLVLIMQASVALALSSGQPIGESFQSRWFTDTGIIGGLKRWIGCCIICLFLGFYIVDMWSNFAAFYPGNGVGAAAISLAASVALSLGDELLHVLADENAIGQRLNSVAYQLQTSEVMLRGRYEKARKIAALKAAKERGAKAGQKWSPDKED